MILILLLFLGSDAAMRPNAIVRSKAAANPRCIHLTFAIAMVAIIPWVVINVNHVFLR